MMRETTTHINAIDVIHWMRMNMSWEKIVSRDDERIKLDLYLAINNSVILNKRPDVDVDYDDDDNI